MSAFLVLMGIVEAGTELDFHWVDDFHQVRCRAVQPSWLTHPSPTASVTTDGQVACFRVDETGTGMKWSASMPGVWLASRLFPSRRGQDRLRCTQRNSETSRRPNREASA
jgi:hypothetical protein